MLVYDKYLKYEYLNYYLMDYIMEIASKKVLINADNTIESSLSIYIALSSPEIEVVGITSTKESNHSFLEELCFLSGKKIPIYTHKQVKDFIKASTEEYSDRLYIASLGDFEDIYQILKDAPLKKNIAKQYVVTEEAIIPYLKETFLYTQGKMTVISKDLRNSVKMTSSDLLIIEALQAKSGNCLSNRIREEIEKNDEGYLILYNPIVIGCILRPALFGGRYEDLSILSSNREKISQEEQKILWIKEVNIDGFLNLIHERLSR